MTRLLQTYLRIAHQEPGPAELKALVNREIPRELGVEFDGKIEPVRELLLSTAIESTTLVQTEMYATVLQGAEPRKCMREAVTVLPMKDNQMTIPVGEAGSYAVEVAEAAQIPISTEDYTPVTLTAHKYGARPVITKEMIEDGLYPVIEMQVRKAGQKIENRINQLMLTEMIDSAGLEHDTAGANQGTKAVVAAMSAVGGAGFLADSLILSPDAQAVVMAEFTPTAFTGSDQVMRGQLPPLFGLKPFVCGVTDASATQTWEYDSDGDIGMLVFDSSEGPVMGMRRDITVIDYDDPIRDLRGMSVTARVAVDTMQANAICRVEY